MKNESLTKNIRCFEKHQVYLGK